MNGTGGPSAPRWRWNREEIAGALGDLGTFLPLLVAMSAQCGLSFPAALFFAGVFNVVTAFTFGIPMAVQPMKAIAAIALAEGLGAAEEVFALLEQEVPAGGTQLPPLRPTIHLDGVGVTYAGRDYPALEPTTADLPPGALITFVGASGGGKSTLLSVLLGFVAPTTGRVRLDDQDLAETDLTRWRTQLGWVPQHPQLVAPSAARPSIRDAVRLGVPTADDAGVERALADAGVLAEVQLLPDGLDTAAADLSAGQARRVALARALLPDPQVLLLDEPTASLDGVSEEAVIAALTRARDAGRTVIVVAHRPAVVDVADVVVHVGSDAARDVVAMPLPELSRTTVTARDF